MGQPYDAAGERAELVGVGLGLLLGAAAASTMWLFGWGDGSRAHLSAWMLLCGAGIGRGLWLRLHARAVRSGAQDDAAAAPPSHPGSPPDS